LQRAKQGAPVAILETNNDITARKRAEEGGVRDLEVRSGGFSFFVLYV
jgi:hypothetical protein